MYLLCFYDKPNITNTSVSFKHDKTINVRLTKLFYDRFKN